VPVTTLSGPEAYVRLVGLNNWVLSVKNLGIFATLYILGCGVLGLLLAVLIDQKVRAEAGFRSVFLYPMALSFIVTGTAWKWLMDPGIGLERSMHAIGWSSFAFGWVKDSDLAIYCVVIAAVWQTSGFVMALFLAGLRGVDTEVVNAARLDGARTWRIYQRVILPQLGASFISAFVILAHMAIKSYDLVIALTNGPGARELAAVAVHVPIHLHAQRDGGRRGQRGADADRHRDRRDPVHPARDAPGGCPWLSAR